MPTLRSAAGNEIGDVQTPSLLLTTRNIQPQEIQLYDLPILFEANEGKATPGLKQIPTGTSAWTPVGTSAESYFTENSFPILAGHPIAKQKSLLKHIKFLKAEVFGKLSCPLPRCQDLPRDFFGTPDALDVVVAVSHGWRNQSHPDPLGKKQNYLRTLINDIVGKMNGRKVYIFLDFLSVSQRPFAAGQDRRSLEEDIEFGNALKCMHNVYFHADFIIHLPWNDYTIQGEEDEYIVKARELQHAHYDRIGEWMQVVPWLIYQKRSYWSMGSASTILAKRSGSVRIRPKAFDRIISVQGMAETAYSPEDLQSFIATTGKAEVRLCRYPFGRINTVPTDERGWIFLERFINMVKCAMLDPEQAQQIIITSSEDTLHKICDGADRLREAVQRDIETHGKSGSSQNMTNLDKVLNEFLVELLTKKFSSVSFDKQRDTIEIDGDAAVVKTIMGEFVMHLKEHWHGEVAGQRNRLGKVGAAMLNYLVEWNEFSIDYMTELNVASMADPTPIALLFLVTLVEPLFIGLVPLEPPDTGWEKQFQFFFTTIPYVGITGLSLLASCWMGLMRNRLNGRIFLWVFAMAVVTTSATFGLAFVLDNFPIPFFQVIISSLVLPFVPAVWWCAPAAQRAEPGFAKRAFCAAGIVASFLFGFATVPPLLNGAMKHVGMWFQALLLACYFIIKLAFIQLGETMARWLGSDTMPIFVFFSTYSIEYTLCQALAGGFDPLHFCMFIGFDTIENGFHLWSLYRQGLAKSHGKAQYIVAGLLLRELCEIMVPCQFLVQFVLMRRVQPRFNHLVCVTEDEFDKAVLFLCLEIAIEVLVGIASAACLRRAGFEPYKMLRGLVATNLPIYICAAGGSGVYFLLLQHSHSGADMTFQFAWLGDARWECGLSWIAE